MLAPRSRWLRCRSGEQRRRRWRGLVSAMQFAVGMKVDGKSDHAVVDAEDARIAAVKARCSGTTRKSCMCAARTNGEMHGTRRIRSRRCGEESYLGDGAREQSLVHGYWKCTDFVGDVAHGFWLATRAGGRGVEPLFGGRFLARVR